jgi:hypothetical protein
MIHVYGLCYRILDYAKKTVDSLRETASEDFHLTCVEGKSCNSEKFLNWGNESLKNKKIQRFITSSTNCRGYGFHWAIKNFKPDNSEDFFILTDLDLLIPKNVDWIKEIRKKMKENAICGFTLSNKNYVYPNYKWHKNRNIEEKLFGCWLMSLNTKIFLNIYEKYDVSLRDSDIIRRMSKHGKRDIINSELYHLGWDAWKDDKDYWEDKKNKNNWNSRRDSNDTDKEPIFKVYTNDN